MLCRVDGEQVFTVSNAIAIAAKPIGLADAGLKEREHLQEWVIANPQLLGPGVKIVAFEFGNWIGHTGEKEKDRLDVLALADEGHLIVVELKRDKAPDTVAMQALKYAALVSRFTRDDLDKVHAKFLSKQTGQPVTAEQAATELDAWTQVTEESLRGPRVILMASEFPKIVTATVVYLHQQLGLDVRLVSFQAYETADNVLITVSQHYPPPGIEEFVLSPEVSEAQQAKTTKQGKQKEINTVAKLMQADILSTGDRLEFQAPSADLQSQVEEWLSQVPNRRYATWQDDATAPLVWEVNGQPYSPTGLARLILDEGAQKTSPVQGPLYWLTESGESLVELAANLPPPLEIPLEAHLSKLSPVLEVLWKEFDAELMQLGPDIQRQSRKKAITYVAGRKLCDLLIHADHLSVYIRGLGVGSHPIGGVIVSGTAQYLHVQIREPDDIAAVVALLNEAYVKQAE
jgi:hypothetical protein